MLVWSPGVWSSAQTTTTHRSLKQENRCNTQTSSKQPAAIELPFANAWAVSTTRQRLARVIDVEPSEPVPGQSGRALAGPYSAVIAYGRCRETLS